MRYGISSLLVVGCIASTALGFQAPSGGPAAGKACPLLSRDLVMRVVPDAGKKALEREKPVEDPYAEEFREAGRPLKAGISCKYGPVLLVLNPLAQPAEARNALRTRAKPYQAFESIAGVGDAAFFRANSSVASMYVWIGSQHFLVEFDGGLMEDARGLKPNTIELAKGIVSQLR